MDLKHGFPVKTTKNQLQNRTIYFYSNKCWNNDKFCYESSINGWNYTVVKEENTFRPIFPSKTPSFLNIMTGSKQACEVIESIYSRNSL